MVKFLTVVSIYHMVFANTQLINIKCLVKAFVESSIEAWQVNKNLLSSGQHLSEAVVVYFAVRPKVNEVAPH